MTQTLKWAAEEAARIVRETHGSVVPQDARVANVSA